MSDLISRQAAIKAIDNLPNCYNGYSDTYDKAYIIGTLEEVPTAEPKRGRWEHRNIGGWHCSLCDEQAPFWCMASTQNLSNYCPNCGARMERSEE